MVLNRDKEMEIQGSTVSERILCYIFGETKKCKYCGTVYRTLTPHDDDDCCFNCLYFDVNAIWKEAERFATKVDLLDWGREIRRH
jgi:Iap family predicted aminopeptidase